MLILEIPRADCEFPVLSEGWARGQAGGNCASLSKQWSLTKLETISIASCTENFKMSDKGTIESTEMLWCSQTEVILFEYKHGCKSHGNDGNKKRKFKKILYLSVLSYFRN